MIVDYLLKVYPLSIKNEEAIFKFRFLAKYKEIEGDRKKVLDQTLGVAYSRMLISGFPSNEKGSRGAVYWLAITFEDYYNKN